MRDEVSLFDEARTDQCLRGPYKLDIFVEDGTGGAVSVNQAQLITCIFECCNCFNKTINLQVKIPVVEYISRSKMRKRTSTLKTLWKSIEPRTSRRSSRLTPMRVMPVSMAR